MTSASQGGRRGETVFVEVELHRRVPDAQVQGERITAWGQTDYMQALTNLAAELDIPLEKCAQRFGTVTLAKNDNSCRFHPALGFTRAKT